jgi:hypothetical protein
VILNNKNRVVLGASDKQILATVVNRCNASPRQRVEQQASASKDLTAHVPKMMDSRTDSKRVIRFVCFTVDKQANGGTLINAPATRSSERFVRRRIVADNQAIVWLTMRANKLRVSCWKRDVTFEALRLFHSSIPAHKCPYLRRSLVAPCRRAVENLPSADEGIKCTPREKEAAAGSGMNNYCCAFIHSQQTK